MPRPGIRLLAGALLLALTVPTTAFGSPAVEPAVKAVEAPAPLAKATKKRIELTARSGRASKAAAGSWGGSQYRWTHVNKKFPDDSYWNQDRDEGAKVGYAYDQSGNVYRSFFQFDTAPINGARVISSSFSIVLDHSPTGTPTNVDLFETYPIDPDEDLTWNSTTDSHWQGELATAAGHAWTGHEEDMEMAFGSDALTQVVQWSAESRTGFVTLGLRAPDETGTTRESREQWKKFRPETAKLIVEYNNLPRPPIKLNLTRPRPCGTAAAPTLISTARPTFAAVASDPDGDNIKTRLLIRRATDNKIQYQQESAFTTSGAAFSWPQVPDGKLVDGATYAVSARSDDGVADDGADFGDESPKCFFKVDLVKPGTPTVASTDFPDGAPGVPARTVGRMTLRPAAGDTDVVEYLYGFQADRIDQRIKAGPDGTATLPVTVWPDDSGIPTARLFVLAVDKAGNTSPDPTGWDLTARPNPSPQTYVRGDVNGDGRADVDAVIDQGFGRTAIWNVTAKAGGFETGAMAFDSGENGGFPLYRTRPAQGDFDGDGRADTAFFREEAGRRMALYSLKSDGNTYAPGSLPDWRGPANGWVLSTARVVAGNVNGDKRSDIVVQVNNGDGTWRAEVYQGGDLAHPASWLAAAKGQWAQSTPVLADVDGDGRADLVDMKNAGGCRTVVEYYRSTGTTFAPTPVPLFDSGAGKYCWERNHPVVGDVDGDGKDDIVSLYENTPGQPDTTLKVFRSTGTALTLGDWWHDAATFDPAKVVLSVGDFTGDHLDDVGLVAALADGGREVSTLTSTGTSFKAPVSGWKEPRVGATAGPTFDIEHRTYELVARHSGRCLEVAGGTQDDGGAITQQACAGELHQRFRLEQVAGTEQFEAHTVHAEGHLDNVVPRCLDVDEASDDDDVPLQQWACVGTANQQMTIEYVEGSGYDTVVRLKFAQSGKCAAVRGAKLGNGVPVVQMPCAAAASQQWILRAAVNDDQLDGTFRVRAVRGGKVFDVEDCDLSEGADLRTWDEEDGSECQQWQVKPLGDDVYQLVAPSTGQLVQIEGCSGLPGTSIEVMKAGASSCQRWRIEPAYDGSWSIQEARTGLSIDVLGCSEDAGARLNISPYWNGPCQRFDLEGV
ncbi:RICIN domain-containing protein [Kribbella ginsengisoli]|uniref:Ricin B lectin domain-containing protein n=1 Tax=Kribbella ginsengisoli TaxID=363865 RepID=A0ABP6W349_9ACTN